MTVTLNNEKTVAIDRAYYWQPIETCPHGVKVQLLGSGGVAYYSTYSSKEKWPTHWAPLPTLNKEN